jgi:tetratricopeptide (TPR) repeat protein
MSFRRLLLALCLFAAYSAQAQHVSCNAITSDMPAPNSATALYWSGHAKEAAASFAELLAAKPGDPELTEGAVRANIELGDVATAESQAQAAVSAHPESAAAVTAQGEVFYRQGKIPDADRDFAKATHLDPCYAPARLGIFRIAAASSMYASAQAAINTAHALNQRDPDIASRWVNSRPLTEEISEAKKYAATLPAGSELAGKVRDRTSAMEDRLKNQQEHHCEVASPIEEVKIPLAPILWDSTHVRTYGLETEINGHTARLMLDSGASGLMVGHAFATQAGLKPSESLELRGFGDHGAQKGYVAYADVIKVGKLEFHNCTVEVSDRRDIVGNAGLIGADVFRHYLVSINYPDHTLELSQLPPLPNTSAASASLDTSENEDQEQPADKSSGPHDRYIAPQMKNFTPVYRFGHWLLIPTVVNNVPEGLMALDTGDGSMSLSYEAAKTVTHARQDTETIMKGLSGKVEKLAVGGNVDVGFARIRVPVNDIFVMDNSTWTKEFGTEVSGFIGYPALHRLIFQIDYRDGLVNFIYDIKKDPSLSGS